MYIKSLSCSNFRNLFISDLNLKKGINLFFGGNGQGKSNFTEIFNLFFFCRSLRGVRDCEMLEKRSESAVLKCVFSDGLRESNEFAESGQLRESCQLRGSSDIFKKAEIIISPNLGKKVILQGRPLARLSEFVGAVTGVVFTPESINLVLGGPENRRHYLDVCLSMARKDYMAALNEYKRAIRLKKAALFSGGQISIVRALNKVISRSSAYLSICRNIFILGVKNGINRIYRHLASDQRSVRIAYKSCVETPFSEDSYESFLKGSFFGPPADELERMGSIIYKHLDTIIAREIDSKRILFGPHRDDMVISYGPGPARNFASRGEAKSLALSLKLIEADILLKISGTAPVVVLDDAFSELDLKRRERLFDAFPSGCQIIVTMPDKSLVPESLKYNKAFYSVENGVVNKL